MSGANLFVQKAVGITKQISPWDTLVYSTVNPGLMFALVYIMWAPFLYPGAHMVWAILTVTQMFIIAGLYWLLSCAMPRQGGEYVYISRILHPAVGLMSSFMITFTAVSWTGILCDWILKYSIVDFFYAIGLIKGMDANWLRYAEVLNNEHVRAAIGTLMIGGIWWVYYRGSRAMVKLSWMALIGTIIGAVAYIVANLMVNQVTFAQNWTTLTGVKYEDVIRIAIEHGHPSGFLLKATIMAGSTYIILNTLGATFGANLAGEVRTVQKSQLLALFGSLAILMIVWAIFYGISYRSFGALWTNCLMYFYYLSTQGIEGYPFGNLEPFATILIGIMTKNWWFVFLIAVAFFLATYGSAAGLGFAPTRNIYAWAFDRLIPESFKSLHPRTGSPLMAIFAVILAAEFFLLLDIYRPEWTANIAYTIFTWFLAWIFLGIAGIVFPIRRKRLFEASPPVVKSRILGIPVVSILGLLTLIISTLICIYLLIPFFAGVLPYTMIVMSVGLLVTPVIVYYISRWLYLKRGIDIAIQFMEIPAD